LHFRLVDGSAVDELRPADGGTLGGRKGGRDDHMFAPRNHKSGRKFGGHVAPEGRVHLLVHDARTADRPRNVHDPFGGEARWHATRVGVEGNGVDIGGWCLLAVKNHGGPVTGAHELDASVRRAGQVVGDYGHQHFSWSALQQGQKAEMLKC
jgi:hypothetical protein